MKKLFQRRKAPIREPDEKNELVEQKITFEEIAKAVEQVVSLLRKKGHPHMTVIITDRSVKITEDIMGMPLNYKD